MRGGCFRRLYCPVLRACQYIFPNPYLGGQRKRHKDNLNAGGNEDDSFEVLANDRAGYNFEMFTIVHTRLQLLCGSSQSSASGGRRLSFSGLYIIFFSLVLSLKFQIEWSGIHWSENDSYLKSRISHLSEEKQRTMEITINPNARPDEYLIVLRD